MKRLIGCVVATFIGMAVFWIGIIVEERILTIGGIVIVGASTLALSRDK